MVNINLISKQFNSNGIYKHLSNKQGDEEMHMKTSMSMAKEYANGEYIKVLLQWHEKTQIVVSYHRFTKYDSRTCILYPTCFEINFLV